MIMTIKTVRYDVTQYMTAVFTGYFNERKRIDEEIARAYRDGLVNIAAKEYMKIINPALQRLLEKEKKR